MTDLNDLLVRLDATTEQMRRELRQGEKRVEKTQRRIDRSMAKVDASFRRAAGAAGRLGTQIGAVAGALAVRAMTRGITNIVDLADAMGKAAQAADVTTDQLQELRFAFGQLAGTTDKQIDDSLRRFTRRLGEARRGAKEYSDTFDTLQVNIRQTAGQALEQALVALAAVRNEADRAALASKLFGERAGPLLAGALGNGIEGLRQLRAQLRQDGGIISAESIDKAEALNDQWDRMGRTLTATTADAILQNAEALDHLAESLGRIAAFGVTIAGRATTNIRGAAQDLAASIGGVATDDIPRMREHLQGLLDELERARGSHVNPRTRAMTRDPDQIIRDIRLWTQRLEAAQRAAAAVPVPGINPTVEVRPTPRAAPGINPTVDILAGGPTGPDPRLEEALGYWRDTRTETEQLQAQIERVQELAADGFFKAAGIDDQQVLERLNAQLAGLEQQTVTVTDQIADAFVNGIGGSIEEMFRRGEFSLESFTEAFLKDLAEILLRLLIIKPLVEGLGGALGGGAGGTFSIPLNPGGKTSATSGIPKFNKGSSFTVGGSGGADTKFMPMMLSPGERVDITPASGGGGPDVQIIDQRGAGAPPVDVQRAQVDGREVLRVLVRSEVQAMMGDGSLERTMRVSGLAGQRRGVR